MSNEEREKNIETIRENIKKLIMFPKDEFMEVMYDILGTLKTIRNHLNYRSEEYLINAFLRLNDTIKTYEETIFWLEKNRDSIGEDDE